MANLAEAVSRLCEDYLIRPESEASAYAERAILQAIEHYAPERLGFNEVTVPLTITATDNYSLSLLAATGYATGTSWRLEPDPTQPPGSRQVTVSYFTVFSSLASILAVDQVVANDAGHRYTLRPLTLGEVTDWRNGQRTAGRPSAYCVYNKAIQLDCASDTSISDEVFCHVQFEEVTADQSTDSPWLVDGQQLILARAASQVFRTRLKDYEAASAMGALEQEELATLRERSRLLQSVGRLRGSW